MYDQLYFNLSQIVHLLEKWEYVLIEFLDTKKKKNQIVALIFFY